MCKKCKKAFRKVSFISQRVRGEASSRSKRFVEFASSPLSSLLPFVSLLLTFPSTGYDNVRGLGRVLPSLSVSRSEPLRQRSPSSELTHLSTSPPFLLEQAITTTFVIFLKRQARLMIVIEELTIGPFRFSQVLEAKIPQAILGVEGEDARINSKFVSSPLLLRLPSRIPRKSLESFLEICGARTDRSSIFLPSLLLRSIFPFLLLLTPTNFRPFTRLFTVIPSFPPPPPSIFHCRMIKDDRLKGEDERGAFARGKDVSDKVDIRVGSVAGQMGGIAGMED